MTEKPEKPVKPPRGDWKTLHLWQIQGVRDVLVGLGVLGLLWLGQKTSIVTVPLLLAILLAYLFEPVIVWVMARFRLQRQGAVASVLVGAIAVVIVPSVIGVTFGVAQSVNLVSRLATDVNTTSEAVAAGNALKSATARLGGKATTDGSAPDTAQPDAAGTPANGQDAADHAALPETPEEVAQLRAEYDKALTDVSANAGKNYRKLADLLYDLDDGQTMSTALASARAWLSANAQEIASAGAGALRSTLGFFGSLFSLAFMAFITAFFFFFFATGWVAVKDFGHKLLPEKHKDLTLDLLAKFDRVISAFIRGRLTIAFLQSIVFTVGYLIIGVPAAFILGPVVAVLSIVPYLALVGVPVSIVLLAAESHTGFRGQWWWIVFAPTAFYFIGQALDDYVWTPSIQGKSTDMSTPMILFASLAGGVLFGVFGLLIAIPVAACVKILIQEVFWPRFKAWAEGREKDFLPIGRD